MIGQRSLCSRDQVGAVVVDASNRIVDTGYNGPPRGFPGTAIDAAWNIPCTNWCPRAAAARWRDGDDVSVDFPDWAEVSFHGPLDDYSDCPSVHAEVNALLFGDRTRREGGTLYVSSGVCFPCAKLVANSGVARVVIDQTRTPEYRLGERATDFMVECGLDVTWIAIPVAVPN